MIMGFSSNFVTESQQQLGWSQVQSGSGELPPALSAEKLPTSPATIPNKLTTPAEYATLAPGLDPGITFERAVVMKTAETPNTRPPILAAKLSPKPRSRVGEISGQIVSLKAV